MTFLCDVSLLVALLWNGHTANERASQWVKDKKLAVCPITELGFIRVSVYAHGAEVSKAREMLSSFLTKFKPKFTPCDVSALDGIPAFSAGKTTDFYLANLAEKHGMKLATLDEKIDHKAAFVI